MSSYRLGTIVFQGRNNNWVSEAIKRITRSKWSHNFIMLESLLGRQALYEAGKRETIINFLDVYQSEDDYCEFFELDNIYFPREVVERAVYHMLDNYLFIDYGYPQLLGILLVYLAQALGIGLKKNPIKYGVVCSETLYYFLERLFILRNLNKELEELHRLKEPNSISPEELYIFIINRPYLFKKVN